MDQRQREKNTAMLEWFDALVLALTLVLVLLLFVFRTVNVDGTSMVPTLQNKDQVIAQSFLYHPQRGDVVVIDGYTNYGEPLVKRVIGVGGDTIDIDFDQGVVYVNGNVLEEPYISDLTHRSYDMQFPLVVPQGKVFLMGDNRPNSLDSRHSSIGFIDERDILGKVVFRLLPLTRAGGIQ